MLQDGLAPITQVFALSWLHAQKGKGVYDRQMTWRELDPEQLQTLRDPLIIDVRSPCEHAAEFIPASVNIPLLDDDERAQVGTVYAQQGEIIARRLAVTKLSPKIPSIIDQILGLRKQGQAVVVHCWRGGLRSEAVSSFLSLVGIDCWRLTGGYKAWRRLVIDQLGRAEFNFGTITLQGQTGVGKSELLTELAALGAPVLDLEILANHRGSVFGGIGLGDQPTQKNFEASVWMGVKDVQSPFLFIEAEGKKVGKLAVPEFLLKLMTMGPRVLVTGSVEARVERIFQEYSGKYGDSFEVLEHAFGQLQNLKERLGAKRIEEIKKLVVTGEGREAIKILLVEYYDPLYRNGIERLAPYELTVSGDDPKAGAKAIFDWYATSILPQTIDRAISSNSFSKHGTVP